MPRVICSRCGRVRDASPCAACKPAVQRQRDARRGTTTERGLGWAHQQQRAHLIAQAEQAGPLTHCPTCGDQLSARNPITAEHTTARAHGGQLADDLECRRCNSSKGATIRRR